MRRILVATVGGQPDPIVTAIRENAPLDRVIFLCSSGSGAGASSKTVHASYIRRNRGHCPHCDQDFETEVKVPSLMQLSGLDAGRVAVETCDDPDDLSQLLAACERIEASLARQWPRQERQVIANYSGGTKTMSLALGLYALRRRQRGWTLQLNRLPSQGRSDLVHIQEGDQPVLQDVSTEAAQGVMETALWLAERHHTVAAETLLSAALARETIPSQQQQKLLRAQLHCRLALARDRLDFPLATRLARQDRAQGSVHGPWLEGIDVPATKESRPVDAVSRAELSLRIVDEVRDSAERRTARNEIDAALQRWVLAIEVLVARRCESSGIESTPGDLIAGLDLLAQQKDALGRYGLEHRKELLDLLEFRRSPFTRRGMVPLPPHRWCRIEGRLRSWLEGAQEIL